MKKGESGAITKFTKEFWKTVVAYGGADETIIRNYDILKDRKGGLTHQQIATKHGISKRQVIRICLNR